MILDIDSASYIRLAIRSVSELCCTGRHLSLACATAQQSYCHGAGVRCTKLWGKVPIHNNCRLFFERFLRVFFFPYPLTWDHMGGKISNDTSSESTQQHN